MEYRSSKSKERQSFNYGPKGRFKPKERKHVQINVGLMVPHETDGTDLKPLRGKTLPLFTDPEVAAPDLLKQAVQKIRTFNKDMHEGPYNEEIWKALQEIENAASLNALWLLWKKREKLFLTSSSGILLTVTHL